MKSRSTLNYCTPAATPDSQVTPVAKAPSGTPSAAPSTTPRTVGTLNYRAQSATHSPTNTPREKVTLDLPGWPGSTSKHLIATITQFTTPQGRRMWRTWYYPEGAALGTYSKIEAARAALLTKVVNTTGLRRAGGSTIQGLHIEHLGWPLVLPRGSATSSSKEYQQ